MDARMSPPLCCEGPSRDGGPELDARFMLPKDAEDVRALITSNEFVLVARVENEQRRLSHITMPRVSSSIPLHRTRTRGRRPVLQKRKQKG